MKQFDELYNLVAEKNEELPTIYCDMDMVLCDFLKGAEEVLGVPFPQYPDKKEKWKKISSTPNFWEKLNWMPGSQRMWNFINKYDAHILSAYSTNDPNSRKGKLAWFRFCIRYKTEPTKNVMVPFLVPFRTGIMVPKVD